MPLKNLPLILLFLLFALPFTALADDVIWEYNDDGGTLPAPYPTWTTTEKATSSATIGGR